jgi:hypothetical protein
MAEEETVVEETTLEHGAFYDGLTAEQKADPSAEKFKGADNSKAFDMYRSAQSMIGKDKIVRADMNNPEDVARFYKDLGVPETEDGYQLKGAEWASEAGYDLALKAKLLPWQADIVEQEYLTDIQTTMERERKEQEETNGRISQQIRQELGAKHDEFMGKKDKLIDTFSRSPESAQALKALATTNPEVAASLGDIASVLSEHSLGGFVPTQFTLSPAEASAQVEAIRANPDHPYNKLEVGDPAHQAAVDEVNRLTGLAMGIKITG